MFNLVNFANYNLTIQPADFANLNTLFVDLVIGCMLRKLASRAHSCRIWTIPVITQCRWCYIFDEVSCKTLTWYVIWVLPNVVHHFLNGQICILPSLQCLSPITIKNMFIKLCVFHEEGVRLKNVPLPFPLWDNVWSKDTPYDYECNKCMIVVKIKMT